MGIKPYGSDYKIDDRLGIFILTDVYRVRIHHKIQYVWNPIDNL
jgi:hypothetical protein